MAILDNLTKAAKGFFIEEDEQASAATPAPVAPALATPATTGAAGPAPLVTQAEQRHLDHIASLLVGDGKDFGAYTKMVSSMASSGLTGPLLYQTAFNAFSALTGVDRPALLASAEQLTHRLADDRARVLQRHREKLGEATSKAAPGPLALLQQRESQLQADVAALTQQLTEKSQQLRDIQQQAQAEKQKTQAALASYELANAAAAAELQAHRQAAQNFLSGEVAK
ncbi:hypothetical protein AUC43_17025 [Hymenobacter sedentarius]|uniref:KfrA N-terminal DNA-binding domain-containing protein n=1 Tax=Hymenobacter sedentarius TaxID=1411621 RepID=A0A0U3SKA9_9BACT|nr:hypothetical protein [Hymenobacter sedentarius]ALW86630.1 hypothetical protein AUC43_17025 [Hymenobacter sedentarius]